MTAEERSLQHGPTRSGARIRAPDLNQVYSCRIDLGLRQDDVVVVSTDHDTVASRIDEDIVSHYDDSIIIVVDLIIVGVDYHSSITGVDGDIVSLYQDIGARHTCRGTGDNRSRESAQQSLLQPIAKLSLSCSLGKIIESSISHPASLPKHLYARLRFLRAETVNRASNAQYRATTQHSAIPECLSNCSDLRGQVFGEAWTA